MKKIVIMLIAAVAMCASVQGKTVKKTFTASGNCNHCKARIQDAAKATPGVMTAAWNKDTKTCSVVFDDSKTNISKIEKAVANAGHDTDKYKATAKAYASLPSCCKYRK